MERAPRARKSTERYAPPAKRPKKAIRATAAPTKAKAAKAAKKTTKASKAPRRRGRPPSAAAAARAQPRVPRAPQSLSAFWTATTAGAEDEREWVFRAHALAPSRAVARSDYCDAACGTCGGFGAVRACATCPRAFHRACLDARAFDDSAWNDIAGDLGGSKARKGGRKRSGAHAPDQAATLVDVAPPPLAAEPRRRGRPPKAPARGIPEGVWHCPHCAASHAAECVRCGMQGDSETRRAPASGELLPCDRCPRAFHHKCARGTLEAKGDVWRCVDCADAPPSDDAADVAVDDAPAAKRGKAKRPSSARRSVAAASRGVEDRVQAAALRRIAALCLELPRAHFASVFGSRLLAVADLAEAEPLRTTSRPAIAALAAIDAAHDVASVSARLAAAAAETGGAAARDGQRGLARRCVAAADFDDDDEAAEDVAEAEEEAEADDKATSRATVKALRLKSAQADENLTARRRAQFAEQGICCVPGALSAALVDAARDASLNFYDDVIYTISQLGKEDDLEAGGFSTFKQRDQGRVDAVVPALLHRSDFAALRGESAWLPLVRAVLGPSARLCHMGVILALPGSIAQRWHSDGDHVHDALQLKPHALNVFLPLVDVTAHNGATEFMPETHLDWHARSRPLVLDAKKGDAIIFDWRLKHRGLANRSNEPRPMIYLTYALPWFVDRYNFSTDRYDDLPPMVPRSSRAERTSRRDESAAANAPLSAAADDSDDEEDDEEDDDNDDDGSDDDNENDGSDDGSDDENDDDADAEE